MGEGVQYSRLLSFSWPYSVTDCWVDRLPAVLPQWQRHQLGVIIILLSKAQGGCTEVILLHSLSALTLPRAITDAMPRTPRGCVTLYVCLWGDLLESLTCRKPVLHRVSGSRRGKKLQHPFVFTQLEPIRTRVLSTPFSGDTHTYI